MTNEQIKESLQQQLSKPISNNNLKFEVKEVHTTIKEYSASDLPAYFKWECGNKPWYFRVRNADGKIIADQLKETYEGLEYQFSTIDSAFSTTNKPITEDEWRNVMHRFQKQLR